jgi:sulfite reductase (ferredoxin)
MAHPEPLLTLPACIAHDVAGFSAQVARLQSGDINPTAFRAYRVPMGVYEQRESGRYMVRTRLGAGLVWAHQLERVAELSAKHGNGVLHVTTRQDIQIHDLPLESLAPVLSSLLELGLSARGGGGNTVRNVTACPRAAFCSKAVFDVAPHAIAAAEYLLQSPRSFNLPRKYKIAFSGCGEDCAFASVNDLGFFAHERNGQQGFAVYAAGGLGSHPAVGVLIDEFISPSEIFEVAEAIERLFERLGDRTDKNQARLRHVLRRLGREAFMVEYRQERATLKKDGLPESVPAVRPLPSSITGKSGSEAAAPPPGFLPERGPSRLTLHVQLLNGRIASQDLIKLARLAREHGVGLVVATQQQDLLVPGIPADRAEAARAAFAGLSIAASSHKPKIVACAGASTCKLGLCLSPALADALEERLRSVKSAGGPETIRISGCPNNCGNHAIAELGFEGRARRSKGRLMPLYEVLADGKVTEGQAQFAQRLGTVPAQRIPDLVAEIYAQGVKGSEALRPLVQRYAQIPEDAPDKLTTDVGGCGP